MTGAGFPHVPRYDGSAGRFLPILKDIENGAENVLIRSRASNVRTDVEKVLFSYYIHGKDEALEVIGGFLTEARGSAGFLKGAMTSVDISSESDICQVGYTIYRAV